MSHLEIPGISAKWVIGFFGLFHISVAAMAIGMAFIVAVLEIYAYRNKIRRYDLFAKRTQLFHVCIYNIGTINAIGLVFALSGLYPQFWSQIFVHFFWPLIIEEFLFFLLATTLTFHYFFWEHLWGHKKLHITLGVLLIPLFFLQMYIINGLGGFMLTPGFKEGEVSLFKGILGYDFKAMYNPSFLMLQLHRALANISYAGFCLAGWCGIRLYLTDDAKKRDYYEDCGRIAYYIAFAFFLSIPIIGYFYSHVMMKEASQAFWDLMLGRGDILVLGIDTWWLKHFLVAAMLGSSLVYFHRIDKTNVPFSLPKVMVWSIALFYLMFYMAMGMVMTWLFFWLMFIAAIISALISLFLLHSNKNSARALFILLGVISFLTVMLGGYAREASRPRFVDRVSAYDNIYVPEERSPYLMVPVKPGDIPIVKQETTKEAQLIHDRCVDCHTLDVIRDYKDDDWDEVIKTMINYGTELTEDEAKLITEYLKAGKPF
ncbi:MAG: cytochrome ubiquinol oxidase subunit I [Candidatus Latescibacteria bacterium]|nr:cytochrome ubiquinol oxidase subunit I [Candidatus Latescibacterota bacterium]